MLTLDAHLNRIMYKSRDPKELEYVWKEWRNAVGPQMRSKYVKYVELNNIAAKENGYRDAGYYKQKSKYDVSCTASRRTIRLIIFY